MSIRELSVWNLYRAKYGPMNDVRRFDRPAALIASTLINAYGGKTTMKELMPFGHEDREATVEDLIKAFGGVKIAKRR